MKLEKVYDELYGMIEDLKKKIGAGGSKVTITPALESGEKVADYTIGDTEGSLYAPSAADMFSGIDTSAAVQSYTTTTFTEPISYTATSKCFAAVQGLGSSGTVQTVSVNGVLMGYFGASMSSMLIPLIPGDVITTRSDQSAESCDMRMQIYNIRQTIPPSPGPENETKIRRKK